MGTGIRRMVQNLGSDFVTVTQQFSWPNNANTKRPNGTISPFRHMWKLTEASISQLACALGANMQTSSKVISDKV